MFGTLINLPHCIYCTICIILIYLYLYIKAPSLSHEVWPHIILFMWGPTTGFRWDRGTHVLFRWARVGPTSCGHIHR
jgi:hypothetical protein